MVLPRDVDTTNDTTDPYYQEHSILIRVHSVLMLVAFNILGPIAIFFASWMRPVMAQRALWFQVRAQVERVVFIGQVVSGPYFVCIPLDIITVYHWISSLYTIGYHHCIPLDIITVYHWISSLYTIGFITVYHWISSLYTIGYHHCIPLDIITVYHWMSSLYS